MSQIVIELDDAVKLATDGKSFVLNPAAEASIVKLMDLQESIEKALKTVKESIKEQGLKINPDFTGASGDIIHASYRHFGAAYKVNASKAAKDFYVTVTSYRPNTTAIEAYLDSSGKLPDGVESNKREKVISIRRKDK